MQKTRKSISFAPDVYELITLISEREGRSPAEQIEWVFKKHYPSDSLTKPKLFKDYYPDVITGFAPVGAEIVDYDE